MTFFAYEDWTTETHPRCFYCGIGTIRRARDLNRNNKHKHVKRHFGIDRRIVAEFEMWTLAQQWEVDAIHRHNTFYKDNQELGCNFTRGGDGCVGYKHSKRTKQHLSQVLTRRVVSDETRAKQRVLNTGRRLSESAKKKCSIASKRAVHHYCKNGTSCTCKQHLARFRTRKFTEQQEFEVRELYASGVHFAEIARIMRVSSQTIIRTVRWRPKRSHP